MRYRTHEERADAMAEIAKCQLHYDLLRGNPTAHLEPWRAARYHQGLDKANELATKWDACGVEVVLADLPGIPTTLACYYYIVHFLDGTARILNYDGMTNLFARKVTVTDKLLHYAA